ncbi:exonuclease SbcCD subunit D [Mobilitalea sibirica]|uniref:Nuclease SbcCD subunit D n=1 Tax=Mobilitalea sibirica TaxID=1462919 RepID=A0A8J7KWH6_9FIRM|nr:exonuclease SbcCD subunit D [Mobilitalea sibirica]MBH1940422.1 exonuclease SbcCD subunit D [Mobilitalea sibirica]
MKFLHTSDLHIGKRVNEFSMLEDQEYILEQILNIVDEHKPEGILIAGDIYDKGIPGVEAVTLFDRFLTRLHKKGLAVFMVSGNHDSSERIDFGGRIMEENRIHIAGTYQGKLDRVTLSDEYGLLYIYLMPFVKPAIVRRYYPEVETYQEAVEAILNHEEIDNSKRNILIAHQFITSGETRPEQCDSENISIGGLDNIDASVFEAFDYVALGHLHGPQRIGRDTIRYAGSPLKYSFSEAQQIKSVTLVTIAQKTEVTYEKLPLVPLRDMREIKGPMEALTDPKIYSQANTLDYIHATLTDEEDIYDPIGKLRSVYPNIMRLDFENRKTLWNVDAKMAATDLEQKNDMELFEEFFEVQNNVPMSVEQKEIMQNLLEEMEGDLS